MFVYSMKYSKLQHFKHDSSRNNGCFYLIAFTYIMKLEGCSLSNFFVDPAGRMNLFIFFLLGFALFSKKVRILCNNLFTAGFTSAFINKMIKSRGKFIPLTLKEMFVR